MHPAVSAYIRLHGDLPFDLNVDPEPGESQYAIWLADFPGCMAQGSSFSLALERLRSIAPTFLEEMALAGVEFPTRPPGVSIMRVVDLGDTVELTDEAQRERFEALPSSESTLTAA